MEEKASILIVDDDESICRTLRLVFEKKGYKTETTGSGREAIDKALEKFFNLTLMDIKLPDTEGTELVAPLKEMHPDMMVIMVTAYASLETAVRALNDGASAYIIKPLDMDEVLATVGNVLEKQRLIMENRRLLKVAKRELDERKRAEEVLREREAFNFVLFQYNPMDTIVVDLEGRVVKSNLAKKASGDRLPNIGDVMYKDYAGRHEIDMYAELMKCIRSGKVREFPEQKYGERFLSITISPFPRGAIIISRDITERKQAEETLRESEKRLWQIVQGSSVPTFVIDDKRIITHWNKACENLTGISANEMIGTRKQWLAFYPEERPVMADLIVDGLPEEEIVRYYRGKHRKSALIEGAYEAEDFFSHLGKRGKWLFFTAAPLRDIKGKVIGAIETLQDITKRKKAEAHLIQAAKMGTLGQMASGIAHELNQPLSVIKAGSDCFLKMIKRGEKIDDEELNIITQEMGTQVDRACEIIYHLRTFARLSELVKAKMDINAPIRDVFKILGQQLKVHCIEVKLDLDEKLPSVMADHNRLEQVFINLVTNATDAMDEKEKRLGKEKIEKVLSISSHLENGEVVVTVSDSGIGIPEKIMDRLFEPFFTTKEVGKGTGLGLSISYGIVKDYDGTIDVKSEEGIGTTFVLRFPACLTQ